MPRKRKIDHKKSTHEKSQDAIPSEREIKLSRHRLGQKSNKKFVSEEPAVGSQLTEGLDKLPASDLSLNRKASDRSLIKGQKKLTRKIKRKLQPLTKSSAYSTHFAPNPKRISEKSLRVRSSNITSFSENDESHVQKNLFRLKKLKSSIESEYSILPTKVDEDAQEEISTDSDFSTDFGTDYGTDYDDNIDDGYVKIEELRESIRKSAMYQEKDKASKQTKETDFFDILGEIPDLDNVSLDISICSEDLLTIQIDPSTSTRQIDLDTGKFVDPLTGIEVTSSLSATTGPTEMSEYTFQPVVSTVDLLEQVTFDEDEDLGQAYEANEEKDKEEEESDTLDGTNYGNWFKAHPSRMSRTKFIQAAYDEFLHQMTVYVYDFVNQLITRVVNAVEYGDPGRVISQRLNKLKIMADLDDKLKKLEIERRNNMILNKGTVDYFHRRGDYRCLKEEHPEQIKQLIDKHANVHEKLWDALEQEEQLKNVGAKRLLDSRAELQEMERISNQSVNDMEKLIKNTLYRERFQYMNQFVSHSLKQMSDTRDAIAKRRLLLLETLHTLGRLKEKEEKIENLGNGLNMQNFVVLQAETTAVDTKVYEREQELNALHIRRNKELHVMMHLKEVHSMTLNKVEIKENVLQELLEEKQRAREEVNYQKTIRTNLRYETQAIRQQTGLAGNLPLLLDFDRTAEVIDEVRGRVSKMRQKHTQLEAILSRLKDRCNRGSSI